MYKNKFEIWMDKNLSTKEITRNKYSAAIIAISNEMEQWGFEKIDLYSMADIEFIETIKSSPKFIEKNRRGNQMYSAALNHYINFINDIANSTIEGENVMKIEDVVLIKINKSYYEGMTSEALYKATSISWVASFHKTSTRDIKYYCSVYKNKILEVYDFLGYDEEMPKRNPPRYILHGKVVKDEVIREKLIGLDVGSIHKGSGNPIKYTYMHTLLDLAEGRDVEIKDYIETKNENIFSDTIEQLLPYVHFYITAKVFSYSLENIQNFYLSLRTKPFVIISGISGTGKTKIVQLFAESIGATEENKQFKLIPVRPDWSDSSELLGYTDIKGNFIKGPLTEMIEHAHNNLNIPHFILLDEMNLARVEYYFSDVLSVMESRKREGDVITSSTLITINGEPLTLPGNLYIIGTVNMDETTHPFSKKVLDRANTLEFNEINLMNFDSMISEGEAESICVSNDVLESTYIHLIDVFSEHEELIREVSQKLAVINKHLEFIHAQVGYRVRDEICFYLVHNEEAGMLLTRDEAMDFCIMQKILPRISGSGHYVQTAIEGLKNELKDYGKCSDKLNEMLERLNNDGFTSFWIS